MKLPSSETEYPRKYRASRLRFGHKEEPPLKSKNTVAKKINRPSVNPQEIPSATLSILANDCRIDASVPCSAADAGGVTGALGKTTLFSVSYPVVDDEVG